MYGLSEEEWQNLRASLKTRVRDRLLNPGAVADLLNEAVQQCSWEELAEALEFTDQSTLRKIANLKRLEPDLLAQVLWGARKGGVSMSVAVELQRLPPGPIRRQAFEQAQNKGFSQMKARQLVKQQRCNQ